MLNKIKKIMVLLLVGAFSLSLISFFLSAFDEDAPLGIYESTEVTLIKDFFENEIEVIDTLKTGENGRNVFIYRITDEKDDQYLIYFRLKGKTIFSEREIFRIEKIQHHYGEKIDINSNLHSFIFTPLVLLKNPRRKSKCLLIN